MSQGIYAIVQRGTGRLYIGASVNIARRWKRHREDLRAGKHHSPSLQRAWTKHGAEAFEWVVLEIVRDLVVLRAREREWLKLRPFFNALSTRDGVVKHSAATRAKMTAAQRRIWDQRRQDGTTARSPEHRAKIAAAHRGMKASPETLAKMSASRKLIGAAHLQTPEARKRSGDGQRGVPKSDHHKSALRAAHQNCRCPKHVAARERSRVDGPEHR